MKAKFSFWIAIVSLFCACGDSGSSQNSGTADPYGFEFPDGSENNTSSFRGWQFTFEGGEDVVELPDIGGPNLVLEQDRDVFRFVAESDAARVSFHLVDHRGVWSSLFSEDNDGRVGGATSASYFRIDFKELNYRCESRGRSQLSFDNRHSIEGSVRGDFTCISGMNLSRETTFETQLEGTLGVTEGTVIEREAADVGPGVFPEGPFPHEYPCPENIVPIDGGGYATLLRRNQSAGVVQADIIDFGSGDIVYTTPDTLSVEQALVSSDGSIVAIEVPVDGFTSLAYVIDVDNDQVSLLPLPGSGSPDPDDSQLVAISADGAIAYLCNGRRDSEVIDGVCLWKDGQVRILPEPPEAEVTIAGPFGVGASGDFTADGRTLGLSYSRWNMRIDLTSDELDFIYRFDEPLPFLPNSSAGPISMSDDGSVVALLGGTIGPYDPLLTVFDETGVSGTVGVGEWNGRHSNGLVVSPEGTKVAFNEDGALKWLEVGRETETRMFWNDFQAFGPPTTVFGSPFWLDEETLIHYRRDDSDYRIYRSTLEPDLMSNAVTEVVACGSDAPGGRDHLFYFSR